jgi:hypothetical protein
MRVLVCGCRHWTDESAISRELDSLGSEVSLVIHGGAKGADTLAGRAADTLGVEVDVYHADWDFYGRSAGPIRNKRMLVDGRPDLVLAFHPDIDASRGTKNMVKNARAAGVRVLTFSS